MSTTDLDHLLARWNRGDARARDAVVTLVYPELRRLAAHMLGSGRRDITLQTTEIVHEAFFKLAGQNRVSWQNRNQVMAICARLLRRVILDEVRRRRRLKRGGGADEVPLETVSIQVEGTNIDVLALGHALDRLARIDARSAQVVELRFFAGLDQRETASALAVSDATVARAWRFARAWLRAELTLSTA